MRRLLGVGLLIAIALGGLARSWATDSSTESSIADPTAKLDRALFTPEIWRLPPVATPPASAASAAPAASNTTLSATPPNVFASGRVPTALSMTPADTFSPPKSQENTDKASANTPLALPGVSLQGCLEPTPTKPKEKEKPWSGSLDLGIDGAEGQSQAFNLRLGFNAKRKTEQTILTANANYLKQSDDESVTTHRLLADARYEWLFTNSRWSCFIHDTIEYDEFQSYKECDTADVGFGNRLIKNDDTTFIGRIGGGYSHYYGGAESGSVYPEAVFGLTLEQRINKLQKFVGTVEYAPDIVDFTRYRIRSQAAIEITLSEEKNLALKIGILDRYTSRQEDTIGNSFDYALMMMWKF